MKLVVRDFQPEDQERCHEIFQRGISFDVIHQFSGMRDTWRDFYGEKYTELCENYIAESLATDLKDIAAYYSPSRKSGLWVAVKDDEDRKSVV